MPDKIAVATKHEFADRTSYLTVKSVDGAAGISDIEGKVARASDERIGRRASFKICETDMAVYRVVRPP